MTDDNPSETMTAVHLHSGIGALAHSFHSAGYRCLATHETIPQLLDVQRATGICDDPDDYLDSGLPSIADDIVARCAGRTTVVTASPNPLSPEAEDFDPILDVVGRIDPHIFIIESTPSNTSVFVEGLDGTPVSLAASIRERFRGRYNVDITDVSAQTHFIGDLPWSKALIVGIRADLADVTPASILPRPRPGGAEIILTAADDDFITPAHAVEIGLLSPEIVIDDDGDDERFDIVCQAIHQAMPPAIADVLASPPPRFICRDREELRVGPAFTLISDLPQTIFDDQPRILALSKSASLLSGVRDRLAGAPAVIDIVRSDESEAGPITVPSAVEVRLHDADDLDDLLAGVDYDLVVGHLGGDTHPRTLRRVIESVPAVAVATPETTVLRLAELLRDDRRARTIHVFSPDASGAKTPVAGLVFSGSPRGDCDLMVVDHSLTPDTYVGNRHSVSQ